MRKKPSLLISYIPSNIVLGISHYKQQVLNITKYYKGTLLLMHKEVHSITKRQN